MGVSAADVTGSGLLDIFKTNSPTTPIRSIAIGARMILRTIRSRAGLAVNTKYLGWGTAFLDFDNDGWKDLIVANGHVYPEVDEAHTAEHFKQPRLLYWNRGDGQVFDLSSQGGPGISALHSSRGLAIGDLDNDGELEIVIVNMGEGLSLLKNVAPHTGNSLLVRALIREGTRSGRGSRYPPAVTSRLTRSTAVVPSSRKATSGCTSVWEKRQRPTYRTLAGWQKRKFHRGQRGPDRDH